MFLIIILGVLTLAIFSNSENEIVSNIGIIIFLAFMVFELAFCAYHFKGLMAHDIKRAEERDFSKQLQSIDINTNIKENLENNYKWIESSYYHKKEI